MKLAQLTDWMPIRVYRQADRFMVDWCYLGQDRFTDPFFAVTIGRRLNRPFNLLFRHQTPIETLAELRAVQPGLSPTGFIFHMSRCGSTLVAQLLAALPQNIVISEAEPIDAVLRSRFYDMGVTDEQRVAWLQAMISALARQRFDDERHFFVKFDSWHTFDLPLIQRAFPEVPWIFLYRDPLDVMVSHRRQPGSQMLPGSLFPGLLGLDFSALAQLSFEEYGARVFATICRAALDNQNTTGQFFNYRHLPAAVWQRLSDHFGVAYTAADRERMQQAAQHDAKNPSLPFTADTAGKQCEATGTLRQTTDQWLWPVYEQLEAASGARVAA